MFKKENLKIEEHNEPHLVHALLDSFKISVRQFLYVSLGLLAVLFYSLKNSQAENKMGELVEVTNVELYLGLLFLISLVALLFFLLNLFTSDRARQVIAIALFGFLGLFWGAIFSEFMGQVKTPGFIGASMVFAVMLAAVAVHAMAAIPWAFRLFSFFLFSQFTWYVVAKNYEVDFAFLGLGFLLLVLWIILVQSNNRSHNILVGFLLSKQRAEIDHHADSSTT